LIQDRKIDQHGNNVRRFSASISSHLKNMEGSQRLEIISTLEELEKDWSDVPSERAEKGSLSFNHNEGFNTQEKR